MTRSQERAWGATPGCRMGGCAKSSPSSFSIQNKIKSLNFAVTLRNSGHKKRLKMAGLNEQIYYSNNKVQKELLLLTTRN